MVTPSVTVTHGEQNTLSIVYHKFLLRRSIATWKIKCILHVLRGQGILAFSNPLFQTEKIIVIGHWQCACK